jgi:prepilin-type N-terminal cleavage/methylation domain-containing protein
MRFVESFRFRDGRRISGFTLIEVLVVLAMILIVSAVALPTVLPALSHRQVSEAARILQAEIVGARDRAIRSNAPCGIRLAPDPAIPLARIASSSTANAGQIDTTQPLVANRIVPLESAPDYSEGFLWAQQDVPYSYLSIPYPGSGGGTYPTTAPSSMLIVLESEINVNTLIANPPTSWFWNVRIGDKIQLNKSGSWYTIVGPMIVTPAQGNSELFVNYGLPGTLAPNYPNPAPGGSPFINPEFLILVNGQDDNGNGQTDEGWDGIDNDGINGVDDVGEWETENWLGAMANTAQNPAVVTTDLPYTIRRRPVPASNGHEVSLPSQVVVDLTTGISNISTSGVASTRSGERSRLPVNPYTGFVDIMIDRDGSVLPTTIYSSPASFGMANAFYHFWLAERADVTAPNPAAKAAPYLPIPLPAGVSGSSVTYSVLKGEYRLLTLFSRSGATAVNADMVFDNPNHPLSGTYNVNLPFTQAQQGIVGGF